MYVAYSSMPILMHYTLWYGVQRTHYYVLQKTLCVQVHVQWTSYTTSHACTVDISYEYVYNQVWQNTITTTPEWA